MDFEEADRLCTRISYFLLSCGGAYTHINGEIEKNILHALATGQYAMKEEGGDIVYFASFWKVRNSEVISTAQRIPPTDTVGGSFCYVTEAANKGGRKGMAEMVKDLRSKAGNAQGVFWHRPVKQDKAFIFPRQKGGVHEQFKQERI